MSDGDEPPADDDADTPAEGTDGEPVDEETSAETADEATEESDADETTEAEPEDAVESEEPDDSDETDEDEADAEADSEGEAAEDDGEGTEDEGDPDADAADEDATEDKADSDDEGDTEEEADAEDGKGTEADQETETETADENGETDEDGDADDESESLPDTTPESLDSRLDEVEGMVDEAETEADLDEAEAKLDEVEADIEAADLPEPDEDEEDEEDEEDVADPRDELETTVTGLRDAIETERGPYAEDAVETIESAKATIEDTRWTEDGEPEVVAAVESFLDSVGEVLDESFSTDGETMADLTAALDDVIETVEARDLDPDDDAGTVADLCEVADELEADLADAEEWDDLSVREKLDAEGFYDVLTPENRKDFPPEWNAIKVYEKQNDPESILHGLEMFGSEYMQGHCIESLKRMGSPEAYDAMEQRAQKRNKPPIEVLGKIGDERALDTLHDYIEGDSDPALQTVTIKAIGEIGSTDSTQAVADRLVAENDTVRSNAARALGLIGDTRAIDPLADVLADDDSNPVRASAAWALNQIGTAEALDAAREHADDRSFLVQTEAEKAEGAMTDEDRAETPA
ncbi:HEAT repeat domain-containing protein [Halococcus sp. IIIV-5B]|nr:HEAT repeat domain-containing protein [Halococcus sp. IIIV-5B]